MNMYNTDFAFRLTQIYKLCVQISKLYVNVYAHVYIEILIG